MMHEGIRPKVNPPVMRNAPNAEQGNLAAQNYAAQAQTDLPKRSERKPFGSMQLKLAYETRPGFHRHVFNDIPGRIDRAREAGYEHVKDKDGKNVSRVVGTAEGGGPQIGFLMEIPEEWYREDMRLEQSHIDEKEQLMKRGKLDAPESGYVPSQGIKISTGK